MKISTAQKKKALSIIKTISVYSLMSFVLLGSIAYTTFNHSKNKIAHSSELAFTEHSPLGEKGGSVVPASCDSSPSISHWGFPTSTIDPLTGSPYTSPDCPTVCILYGFDSDGNAIYDGPSDYTKYYDASSNSCKCDNRSTSDNCYINVTLTTEGAIPAPTLTFTGTPYFVYYHQIARLAWSTTNAQYCVATNQAQWGTPAEWAARGLDPLHLPGSGVFFTNQQFGDSTIFYLQCRSLDGYTLTPQKEVTVESESYLEWLCRKSHLCSEH